MLTEGNFDLSPARLIFLTLGLLICGFLYFTREIWRTLLLRYRKSRKPCDLPVLNLEGADFDGALRSYFHDFPKFLQAGRKNYRHTGFQVWTPEGWQVILPEELAEEIKSAPDEILDNSPLMEGLLGDFHWCDAEHPAVANAIQMYLTLKMQALMRDITSELEYALATEIGPCENWTPIPVNQKLLRIVALISGRCFVGAPLSRNEEWVHASISFTSDLFLAGVEMRGMSIFQRFKTLILHTSPAVERIWKQQEVARRLLVPIIQERQRRRRTDPAYEPPADMIEGIARVAAQQKPPLSPEVQAEIQLLLSLAAIHTTSSTATHILYDLVFHPEYFKPLREEVDRVWKEDHGHLQKVSMSKMVKLDSFMKESFRMNPMIMVAMSRRINARNGYTFSNGLHLPQYAQFIFSNFMMNHDEAIYPNAHEFQGFRFADIRSANKEDAARFQFATTSSQHSMNFGHGRHSCPGRFFSSNEIKTIMAYFIRNYDIRPTEETKVRPKNEIYGARLRPNNKIHLLFKKREGGY